MFVLRKKQILLLVCSARSPQGSLAGTSIPASCICPDARCPDVEDQREPVGTRVPTGEGTFSTTGLLHAFVYEERHSIVPHSFPRGAGPAVSASFGRTSASISITDLIKTDLLARPDPRLSVCVCPRFLGETITAVISLGYPPPNPAPPPPTREAASWPENQVSRRHQEGTVHIFLENQGRIDCQTPWESR